MFGINYNTLDIVGTIGQHRSQSSKKVKILERSINVFSPACIESCVSQGIHDAGVRRGGDCFCFAARPTEEDKLLHVEEDQCREQCQGDPSFFCGGTTALHIYATST